VSDDTRFGQRATGRAASPGRRAVGTMVLAVAATLLGPTGARGQGGAPPDLVPRGKYVFGAAGGCGCHTEKGKPVNSGGRRYDGPFGTVYSTNITPDRQTGIGGWSDEQIITAIRLGRRPNGERLVPVHPYPVFNGMAEGDLRALVVFLRSVAPVNRPNQPKRITVPLFESVFLPAWLAAFAPRETPPPTAPTEGVARGEYLGTGNKPDGDVAQGLMEELIQGTAAGFKDLSQADRLAIARYLKTVPPVRHKVSK